jgi:translation elongation factor EF-Tu-like GTPase
MSFIVEDNFEITGRGIVVTGISDGHAAPGSFYTLNDGTEFQIKGVESHCVTWGTDKGQPIGLLLGDIDRDLVPRGTVLNRKP